MVSSGGSDLHLKVPAQPLIRAHGALTPLPGSERLRPEDTEAVLRSMLQDEGKLGEFARDNEVDFAYAVDGLARFRVNAFRQRGSVSMVLRAIPFEIRRSSELGLPPVIAQARRARSAGSSSSPARPARASRRRSRR